MANKAQTYKGMKDYLPPEMRLRQYIVNTLTRVFEQHGFEPMQTPIVEYEDTLKGKFGDEEKLMYRLQYGDDRLALRYDQTVSLARVIGQYPNAVTFPFRRYAVGPNYRGERPQRGRFREFYQADIDIVGAAGPLADAEVIGVIVAGLRALGFGQTDAPTPTPNFRVLINHREVLSGLARSVGVSDADAGGVYRAVDKFDKIGAAGVRERTAKTQHRRNGDRPHRGVRGTRRRFGHHSASDARGARRRPTRRRGGRKPGAGCTASDRRRNTAPAHRCIATTGTWAVILHGRGL